MRRTLWVFAVTGYFVGATVAAGQEPVEPKPMEQVPAATPAVNAYAGGHAGSDACENCSRSGGHASCRCKNRCEAARYRSDIHKGHCEAICLSLRNVADITIDVPYSFYEWCRKIKNTVLDRGTCRNRGCAHY
jgi:hypothetical protein